MKRTRRSPHANIVSADFVQWLDNQRDYVLDLDDVHRVYINGHWLTPTLKRELRRYRNGTVTSIRTTTATTILTQLGFTMEDFTNGNHS